MPECINCGKYTKYNGGFCSKCYTEKQNENTTNKPNFKYNYETIKGRIAETLIHDLFLGQGYLVFRSGIENTPGIIELLKGVRRSDVADEIRKMPDFVVQNPKNGEVHFVEVKFRASGYFKFADLSKDYPYYLFPKKLPHSK
jgi:hypothetical protein